MALPVGYTQGQNGYFYRTSDQSGPYSLGSDGNMYLVAAGQGGMGGPGATNWSYAAATGGIVVSGDTDIKAAAGAGLRNYLSSVQVQNASATASEISIRNKTGGQILWRGFAGANSSFSVPLGIALQGAVNDALTVNVATTAAAVYVNAQGYVGA